MEDICNFIPPRKHSNSINYYHFVYEAKIKGLRQPFLHSNYYVILVAKGGAELVINNTVESLRVGTLFFVFPGQKYTIKNYKDFSYMYISFNGDAVEPLFKEFGISKENFIFDNFGNVNEFWISAIRRINPVNANALTESVLMYTLSFINTDNPAQTEQNDKFESILSYINYNYASADMSVKRVAEIFFYNEKYLSSLFVKRTGTKFTDYINRLRIEYSVKQILGGEVNIAELSAKCGYSDQFYFSKVFKKIVGKSPTEYIKKNSK